MSKIELKTFNANAVNSDVVTPSKQFWSCFVFEETGALGTIEFILLATIIVIGLLAGMVEYRDALVLEYGDASAALQSVNQSYAVDWNGDGDTADAGETFTDIIPASVTLDGNGISVNGPQTGEAND